MKSRKLISLLLLVLVLMACQLFLPKQPGGEYPGQGEYPYPQSEPFEPAAPANPNVLYPEVGDGDEMYWLQVVAMINNGEVEKVVQTHDLKVFVTLKDGRTLVTVEPNIDDVFLVIEQCGEKCKDILIATE